MHVSDIRWRTQDDAQNVLDRLAAGEDFGPLRPTCPWTRSTKNKGGDMGWIPRGAMSADLETPIFALAVGQNTQPDLQKQLVLHL